MKRLLTVVLVLLLVFSLAACGGNTETEGKAPSSVGQAESEETGQKEQPIQTEASGEVSDGNGIICINYNDYVNAKDEFYDYVLEQSYDHEVVSVFQSLATVSELNILNYLLPLQFMGESMKSLGKYDAEVELLMFQNLWGDDVEVIYNQDTGYALKGTDTDGSAIEVKAMYDGDADSLRLEGYKDDALALVFEYTRMEGGYAAQYHFKTTISNDKGKPIEGLCTYRTIFEGSNGSSARFDNVNSEPDSIFGNAPDPDTFIEGATHWLTVDNGKFSGRLNKNEF